MPQPPQMPGNGVIDLCGARQYSDADTTHRSALRQQAPLAFALRTTIAALMAWAVAAGLGIHHPWWAAMTVWLVAQPSRGLLLERSLARLVGTACGSVAGLLILDWFGRDLIQALMATAIWLALCAGLGSVFRHFRNYGLVLAGYTAAIIVLFALNGGPAEPGLAGDRVACAITGIVSSALLSFHALPGGGQTLTRHAYEVLHHALAFVESRLLGHAPSPVSSSQGASVATAIGALDRAVDEYAAGSLHRRREAVRTRCISGLLLELVALGSTVKSREEITSGKPILASCGDNPIQRLSELAAQVGEPAAARALDELAILTRAERTPIVLDFDRTAAWRAAARPVAALVVAATIWQVTGWEIGALMTMTAVLFTALFSSQDQGNQMVLHVLAGTLCGALAGIFARVVLLPHAHGLLPILLVIAPFLLLGAWLMRQSATGKMAIDFTMTFLLTSQPGSLVTLPCTVFGEAAAITAGVVIAIAIFWLILPATPEVRRLLLARRISRLTQGIAEKQDLAIAVKMLRSLQITQVRMLDVVRADSDLFQRTQDCLSMASRIVATRCEGAVSGRPDLYTQSELEAAVVKAVAALTTEIVIRPKRGDK